MRIQIVVATRFLKVKAPLAGPGKPCRDRCLRSRDNPTQPLLLLVTSTAIILDAEISSGLWPCRHTLPSGLSHPALTSDARRLHHVQHQPVPAASVVNRKLFRLLLRPRVSCRHRAENGLEPFPALGSLGCIKRLKFTAKVFLPP